ncbi:Nramp family divalent metal transporter [Bacteroidota bacterium]
MRVTKDKFFNKFPGKINTGQMPEPKSLFKVFGPGIILLATALGSGEVYFWPGITMKYGFVLIWPAIIALFVQYILNTEFARYTVLTGETVITGFIRLWKPLGYVFLLGATLPWIWPGWSMGAGTTLSWMFNVRPETIGVVSLLIMGVLLTFTKKSYSTLELVEKILIGIVIATLIILSLFLIKYESIVDLGSELIKFSPRIPSDMDIATLLAALAFCGAGGTLNLATSNYIQEKNIGMSSFLKKKRNKFTGSEYVEQKIGVTFQISDENLNKWKQWWRIVRYEQFFTFFTIGLFGLLVLMLLSHSLVFGKDLEIGMGFIQAEGEQINSVFGSFAQWVFYIAIMLAFFTTAFGVIDHVSRISSDICRTYLINSKSLNKLSQDVLYLIFLWTVIFFGIIVLLLLNINQPPKLLSIAGSLSGVIMFIYSFLILILGIKLEITFKRSNNGLLSNPYKVSVFRRIIIIIGIILYGGLTFTLLNSLF